MIKIISKLPILLVIVFILFMYVIDAVSTTFSYSFPYQIIISIALFIVGFAIIAFGGYLFKKANTTVNPVTPEKATQLVTIGLYRYSRNPMYIGFLSWLVAAAIFFGNPINLLLLPVFVVLVNKLYIVPEEEALTIIFKEDFSRYCAKVNRWL